MAASMSMCTCRSSAKFLRYFNQIKTLRTLTFASHERTYSAPRIFVPSVQFHASLKACAADKSSSTDTTSASASGSASTVPDSDTKNPSRPGSAGGKTSSPSITESILQQRVGAITKTEKDKEETKGKENEKKDKKGSKWTGNNMWKIGLISLGAMGAVSCGVLLSEWGAPRLDKDGKEIEDEFTHLPVWQQYPKRALREFEFYKQLIKDPTSEKLLPDPLKEPYYQPPYTLVLEMTGILVHPDWTYGTGWRFKKRPGVEYFLSQVGPPLFEVVIYTAEQGFTAFPILDSLDPHGYITYRLFRDATRYMKGHHVKDLGCLNRDLSKVIFVDCNPKSYQLQPRNAVGLKKWKGEDEDRSLVDLAQFLRTIAASGIEDVRDVLDYYRQFDDPLAVFKENQRKLQEEQEKMAKAQLDQQKQQSLVGSVASGFFRRR